MIVFHCSQCIVTTRLKCGRSSMVTLLKVYYEVWLRTYFLKSVKIWRSYEVTNLGGLLCWTAPFILDRADCDVFGSGRVLSLW